MLIRWIGIVLIVAGLAANPFVLECFVSHDRYLEPGKKMFIFLMDAILIGTGAFFMRYIPKARFPCQMKGRFLLLTIALMAAGITAEGALRYYLFNTSGDFLRLKSPYRYLLGGPGQDDFWYFAYVWDEKSFAKISQRQDKAKSSSKFYTNWAVSLTFDPLLGYRRKPNVTFPGHETSNLATRGNRQYKMGGEKIVFYGDSFVESNALSEDTLTAKIERKSGRDCLNYGVGGYGLDQVYLLFEQTFRQFSPAETQFLIGVTDDELRRTLLTVRQAAKPYFTVENAGLVLHTSHIDAQNPRRFFEQYHPRFRIFLIDLLIRGITPLNRILERRVERMQAERVKAVTSLLVEKFQRTGARITFVVFSDLGENVFKEELQRRHLPYIDMQRYVEGYMDRTRIPISLLYRESHPSGDLNEVMADCIVGIKS